MNLFLFFASLFCALALVSSYAVAPSPSLGVPYKKMYSTVTTAPEDEIFKVSRMFNECKDPLKVSCGVGA